MTAEDPDTVEVQCPECKKMVRVSKTQAEKNMKTKCPNGHEIQLIKALF
jgi:phage FluMu protein Com